MASWQMQQLVTARPTLSTVLGLGCELVRGHILRGYPTQTTQSFSLRPASPLAHRLMTPGAYLRATCGFIKPYDELPASSISIPDFEVY